MALLLVRGLDGADPALLFCRAEFQYGDLQFAPGHRFGGTVSFGSRGSHS